VVLVSAGVGLTPMLGMLHALAAARDPRSVWFVHGARDGAHHPLADEVDRLVAALPEGHRHVAYSRPRAVDRDSRRNDSEGRIDGARIATLIPQLDAEFYLCGPVAFMARIQHDLEQRGVPPGRIHHESFGPIG
jgi:ferredoxin-NADP reductase